MRFIVLFSLVVMIGCSGNPEDLTRDVLKRADIDVDDFKPTDAKALDAQACEVGAHDELDITACAFSNATSAGIASEKMEDALASDETLTVVVKQKGAVLVGIVDGKNIDPNGKKIAELLKKLD